MLDAYAAGVNAFMQATTRLPIEFQLLPRHQSPGSPGMPAPCSKSPCVHRRACGRRKLWRARLLRHIGPELTAKLYTDKPSGQPLIIPPGLDYRGPALNGLEALRAGEAW